MVFFFPRARYREVCVDSFAAQYAGCLAVRYTSSYRESLETKSDVTCHLELVYHKRP